MKLFLIASLLFFPAKGIARVFNFDEQSLSTYLRGSYGTSAMQRSAYAPGNAASTNFPDSTPVTAGYSGEFGLAFTTSHYMTIRIGVELLYPASTTSASGKDASGTLLFQMDEQAYSVIPQGDFEFFLKRWPNSRIYLGLGAGYAVTTIKNTYTETAAGGIPNYIEEGTGWGIMGQGYLGYEFVAFDNVTLSLDVGYRYLTVGNYSANRNFQAPYGQVATGNPIKNVDGTNRFTNLCGFFSAVNFRFYFH